MRCESEEKLAKIREAATAMCDESFIVITPTQIIEFNSNSTILQEMSEQVHKIALAYGIIKEE